MFKWVSNGNGRKPDSKAYCTVTEGLQGLYKEKLLPVESRHDFHSFYSPELTDANFSAQPMVLLLGQYSTGKTTLIRHLLGRDYPGLRIGPEPTTDNFIAVRYGELDQVIPGDALVLDKSLPFTQLANFGGGFLSRFECATLNSPVLEGISLVDSPGILAGEKQRIKRGYEYESVVKWFADRVDMILLLFDVSKMDISDEFRRVIIAVRGNNHKIHIILNKADTVTTSQLMRVYGAMMWSLGKVIDTPEVSRVYVGSFWDEPLHNDEQRRLFESEENDLYSRLTNLPRSAAVRKLNDLIKRARLAKVHAYILQGLRDRIGDSRNCLATLCGRSQKQQRLIANLPHVFQEIATEENLPLGDFPDPASLQEKLRTMNFSKFARVDKKKIEVLDSMLSEEIPKLLQMIPDETACIDAADNGVGSKPSPFASMRQNGQMETSAYQSQWLVPPDVEDYRADFMETGPNQQGKITGHKAKAKMDESKLPVSVLHKVWTLADVDKDGALTLYEYALAMHFIKMRLDGQDLPQSLPPQMLQSTEW